MKKTLLDPTVQTAAQTPLFAPEQPGTPVGIFHVGDVVSLQDGQTKQEVQGTIYFLQGTQIRIRGENGQKYNRAANRLVHVSAAAAARKAIPTFNINERFALMEQAIEMIALGISPSAIIVGPGGLGKTYGVTATLAKMGKKKGIDYNFVKGFASARGLYEILYENNGRLTVFDDCDRALSDPIAKEILKGALDSYETREITWKSGHKSDIPSSFEFTGQIIFISNRELHNIDAPVRTRSIAIDLQMSQDEILDRMEQILPDMKVNCSPVQRTNAMQFIREWAPSIKLLNLRTMLLVLRTIAAHPNNWEKLALYSVTQG
jgi:hypothetical protein